MTRCLILVLVLATVGAFGPRIAAAQSVDPHAAASKLLRQVKPGVAQTVATKPVARDGQEIRVTMRTGERRLGRFVSLNSSELVMSWGRNREVIPLREVRRIETVSHHARRGALMGLVGGIGFALAVCLADDNFCGDDAGFGLSAAFFGGLGAGIGAGLGAMVNASTADRHVLFENGPNPVAEVAPIFGPGLAGVALKLRW